MWKDQPSSAMDSNESESTLDASETEEYLNCGAEHAPPNSLVDVVYQKRRADLMYELNLLRMGSHPAYLERVAVLQQELEDRLLVNECQRDYELMCADRDCVREKMAAEREFEEGKKRWLNELLERKNAIRLEMDKMTLDNPYFSDEEPVQRKLRHRPGPTSGGNRTEAPKKVVTFQLPDSAISEDLMSITPTAHPAPIGQLFEPPKKPAQVPYRVLHGMLWKNERCFKHGQPVHVRGIKFTSFPATIKTIYWNAIYVTAVDKTRNLRIPIDWLNSGTAVIDARVE